MNRHERRHRGSSAQCPPVVTQTDPNEAVSVARAEVAVGLAMLAQRAADFRTANEMMVAFTELIAFEALALSEEQRVTAEKGAVAYVSYWLQQRGHELPPVGPAEPPATSRSAPRGPLHPASPSAPIEG